MKPKISQNLPLIRILREAGKKFACDGPSSSGWFSPNFETNFPLLISPIPFRDGPKIRARKGLLIKLLLISQMDVASMENKGC